MDTTALLKMWDQSWESGLYAAPWSKAVDGLTGEQAAWAPPSAPGVQGRRHSIWQIVNHVIFWREYALDRAAGGAKLSDKEIEARNWTGPRDGEDLDAGWRAARERLRASHDRYRAAIEKGGEAADKAPHFIAHDQYHLGQIMYVRAMLGLPVIE